MEAEKAAVALLAQAAGSHAGRARLSLDGHQFAAGDFTVRVGAVTAQSEYRGTLVQARGLPRPSVACNPPSYLHNLHFSPAADGWAGVGCYPLASEQLRTCMYRV